MNVSELKEKRRAMEQAIQDLLRQFIIETGTKPQIEVDYIQEQRISGSSMYVPKVRALIML